jgi:hypothetical protein
VRHEAVFDPHLPGDDVDDVADAVDRAHGLARRLGHRDAEVRPRRRCAFSSPCAYASKRARASTYAGVSRYAMAM